MFRERDPPSLIRTDRTCPGGSVCSSSSSTTARETARARPTANVPGEVWPKVWPIICHVPVVLPLREETAMSLDIAPIGTTYTLGPGVHIYVRYEVVGEKCLVAASPRVHTLPHNRGVRGGAQPQSRASLTLQLHSRPSLLQGCLYAKCGRVVGLRSGPGKCRPARPGLPGR